MKNDTINALAPVTKLAQLKALAAAGDWQGATRIAARFPQIPAEHRAAILDAHTAYTNPRFLAQLRKDVEAAKLAGRAALIQAYRLA